MSIKNLPILFLVSYLTLFGGNSYYYQIFEIRVLHHFLVTSIFVVWFLQAIRSKTEFSDTIFSLLIIISSLWLLVASGFSLDRRISLENTWFSIINFTLFMVVANYIQRGRQRALFESIFLVATLVGIVATVEVVTWYREWLPYLDGGLLPPVAPRIEQPFGVSTWLSAYASPLVLLSAAWGLTAKRRDYRIALLLLSGLMVVVLILSGSRGGLLSLVAALVIWIILSFAGIASRLVRRVGISLSVSLIIIAFVSIAWLSQNPGRLTGDMLRFSLWESAVELTMSDPLTGVGPGMFGRGYRLTRTPDNVDDRLGTAHNLYLNTAAELGIPGILLLGGAVVMGVVAWLRIHRQNTDITYKRRLNASGAALIGFAVHSFFDTFTLTAILFVPIVLIAFCVTPIRKVINSHTWATRVFSILWLFVLTSYGIGLILSDFAQSRFIESVSTGSEAKALEAMAIDPLVSLYELQWLYLLAENPSTPLTDAIVAYQHALDLEPTWDTGWINLANFQLRANDIAGARNSLFRAASISEWNNAPFGWAFLAEQTQAASADEIARMYASSFRPGYLPMDRAFWTKTHIRRQAIEAYMMYNGLEVQYRTVSVIFPERAIELVPVNPSTAEEWWVTGHYRLTVEHDSQQGEAAFDEAIRRDSSHGDYYVWRAYARFEHDPNEANRDLARAALLGTLYDDLTLARFDLAPTVEYRNSVMIGYVSTQFIDQNFEGVLFQGRRAHFLIDNPLVTMPVSDHSLRIWFAYADYLVDGGRLEQATEVYEWLQSRYPHNTTAREELCQLGICR